MCSNELIKRLSSEPAVRVYSVTMTVQTYVLIYSRELANSSDRRKQLKQSFADETSQGKFVGEICQVATAPLPRAVTPLMNYKEQITSK